LVGVEADSSEWTSIHAFLATDTAISILQYTSGFISVECSCGTDGDTGGIFTMFTKSRLEDCVSSIVPNADARSFITEDLVMDE